MTAHLTSQYAAVPMRRTRPTLFLTMVVLVTVAVQIATTFCVLPASADGWEISCVDCPNSLGWYYTTDRSLRLDAEGEPHFAYGADHLHYAWRDATGWHREIADPALGVGQHASLVLDESGNPHVSYYDCGSVSTCTVGRLKYAYRNATGWHVETVDTGLGANGSTGSHGQNTSLALDATDHPVIVYRDDALEVLKYAYRNDSGWHVERVDSEGNTGRFASLAMDRSGQPHISYTGPDGPRYARRDSAGWHVLTVDNQSGGGLYTSLVLDSDDYPHMIYHKDNSFPWWRFGTTKYAYQDAVGWHVEVINVTSDGRGMGGYTSLALAPDGTPHVSYYNQADEQLMYAHKGAAGWQTQVLASGVRNVHTSVALDHLGFLHIGYGLDVGALMYARQDAAGWHMETVDVEGSVEGHTSLALGSDGRAHVSYSANYRLTYAYEEAGGWRFETVDNQASPIESTSIKVDAGGYPHIGYIDGTSWLLKYAYKDAAGWHIERVDGVGPYGDDASLALDSGGYPHISYRNTTSGDLRYAYRDATTWHIATLDAQSSMGYGAGYGTSLVLDAAGHPHVSYVGDGPYWKLKHVYRDAAGWHIEVVDGVRTSDGSTSLALNAAGYPHISFASGDLKHAFKDDTGWHIETVEPSISGFWASSPSLALDASSQPHISCNDGVSLKVKYARRDATGWHTETVDDGEGRTYSTSLALDGSGRPRIGFSIRYSDTGTWSALRYAAFRVTPQLSWADPNHPLLLPPTGTTEAVNYSNIPVPATLTATLSGPATFPDGSQTFSADITTANGSYTLQLRPAPGAIPGSAFTLRVTLAGVQLERTGTVVATSFLPLLHVAR